MTRLTRSIAAAALTCTFACASSSAFADGLLQFGSRFVLEFEDSVFTAPETSSRSFSLYDDQLYRDGQIRKGNILHTGLDLAYHYAVRKMSKKMRTQSLNDGKENTHTVRSGFKTSYRMKVSSSKILLGVKYKF